MTLLRMTTRLPRQLIPQLRQTQPIRPTLLSSLPAPAPAPASLPRTFTTSCTLYKKKDKASKKGAAAEAPSKSNASASTSDGPDPFDLSTLETGISTSLSKLKDDLSKLRAGGRFNTSTLENLKVHLGKGKDAEIVKLCDLAQVVPKGGRMVSILAAEEDHIKPITSSIISSNLSLTPQNDPHNPLQLTIPIPPPTKESRLASVNLAKASFEKASTAIRDARGTMHKRLQDMQKKKIARPDDVRNAHDLMEKITEKGHKDVKELFDGARKALE